MSKYYHPITLEHINTNNFANWMQIADEFAPEYDAKTQGCFFRNGKWEVEGVDATAQEREQRKSEILKRLAEIDQESLRPLRAYNQGTATDYDTNKLVSLENEAVALREELSNL